MNMEYRKTKAGWRAYSLETGRQVKSCCKGAREGLDLIPCEACGKRLCYIHSELRVTAIPYEYECPACGDKATAPKANEYKDAWADLAAESGVDLNGNTLPGYEPTKEALKAIGDKARKDRETEDLHETLRYGFWLLATTTIVVGIAGTVANWLLL